MLVADARGLRVSAKSDDLPANFTVLSAAANDQISSSLPEAKHGLFSYLLMRGLEGDADADRDRMITAGRTLWLHRWQGSAGDGPAGTRAEPAIGRRPGPGHRTDVARGVGGLRYRSTIAGILSLLAR